MPEVVARKARGAANEACGIASLALRMRPVVMRFILMASQRSIRYVWKKEKRKLANAVKVI